MSAIQPLPDAVHLPHAPGCSFLTMRGHKNCERCRIIDSNIRERHNLEAACIKACTKAGLTLAVADRMFHERFGCTMDQASPEHLEQMTLAFGLLDSRKPRRGSVQANAITNTWEASAEL